MNSDEEKIMRHAQFLGEDATDYVAGAPHMSPVDVLMSRAHSISTKYWKRSGPARRSSFPLIQVSMRNHSDGWKHIGRGIRQTPNTWRHGSRYVGVGSQQRE